MQDRILALLGIAARAGKIVSGGFSAEEAVRSRKARLVIIAKDAKNNWMVMLERKIVNLKKYLMLILKNFVC